MRSPRFRARPATRRAIVTGVTGVGVVLLGGTSHVGKSTTARALADRLGWPVVSTDQLARHPGRPWTALRPDVHEHYRLLTVAQLADAQLAHYTRMWPLVERLVRDALRPAGTGLVLEGSGVWPDLVAGLRSPRLVAVWLTAPGPRLRDRIRRTSGYAARTAAEREVIDRFTGRTLEYQARLVRALDRRGLPPLPRRRPPLT